MQKEGFRPLKITDNIYWVGAIDRELKEFHGYYTPRGTTYNAYLILDKETVLIDTVKKQFLDEMLFRISHIIDPEKIDIIVSNHAEMDHSGALPEVTKLINPKKVIVSKMGVKTLKEHFGDIKVESIVDGESISIGNLTLQFFETPMLHWPESMVTYIPELKLLFSQDIMGMHLGDGDLFVKEVSNSSILYYEAAKYYANIITPYSSQVIKLLDKFSKNCIDPIIIAPDHGPIWDGKEWIDKILSWYKKWAIQKPEAKAVIIYDTMWGSTAQLAKAISEGLKDEGVNEAILMPLSKVHRSDVATELLESGALIVGSPTINNGIFPTVADVMNYIRGLRFKNLLGGTFGSYGWSGEAVDELSKMLSTMKIEIVGSLKVKYIPKPSDLQTAYNLGKKIGVALKEYIKQFE